MNKVHWINKPHGSTITSNPNEVTCKLCLKWLAMSYQVRYALLAKSIVKKMKVYEP